MEPDTNNCHLNDYIEIIIRNEGIDYAAENYLTLREEYYAFAVVPV